MLPSYQEAINKIKLKKDGLEKILKEEHWIRPCITDLLSSVIKQTGFLIKNVYAQENEKLAYFIGEKLNHIIKLLDENSVDSIILYEYEEVDKQLKILNIFASEAMVNFLSKINIYLPEAYEKELLNALYDNMNGCFVVDDLSKIVYHSNKRLEYAIALLKELDGTGKEISKVMDANEWNYNTLLSLYRTLSDSIKNLKKIKDEIYKWAKLFVEHADDAKNSRIANAVGIDALLADGVSLSLDRSGLRERIKKKCEQINPLILDGELALRDIRLVMEESRGIDKVRASMQKAKKSIEKYIESMNRFKRIIVSIVTIGLFWLINGNRIKNIDKIIRQLDEQEMPTDDFIKNIKKKYGI